MPASRKHRFILSIDGELKGDIIRKVPNDDMDDTRPDNIMALKELARHFIIKNSAHLDWLGSGSIKLV